MYRAHTGNVFEGQKRPRPAKLFAHTWLQTVKKRKVQEEGFLSRAMLVANWENFYFYLKAHTSYTKFSLLYLLQLPLLNTNRSGNYLWHISKGNKIVHVFPHDQTIIWYQILFLPPPKKKKNRISSRDDLFKCLSPKYAMTLGINMRNISISRKCHRSFFSQNRKCQHKRVLGMVSNSQVRACFSRKKDV